LSSAVRVMGEIKEEQNERERELKDASWKAVPREREGRTKE
jgi:hypothetical protein